MTVKGIVTSLGIWILSIPEINSLTVVVFTCIGSNRNTGKDSAEESCCKQNEEIQYSRKVRQNINLNSIKAENTAI